MITQSDMQAMIDDLQVGDVSRYGTVEGVAELLGMEPKALQDWSDALNLAYQGALIGVGCCPHCVLENVITASFHIGFVLAVRTMEAGS